MGPNTADHDKRYFRESFPQKLHSIALVDSFDSSVTTELNHKIRQRNNCWGLTGEVQNNSPWLQTVSSTGLTPALLNVLFSGQTQLWTLYVLLFTVNDKQGDVSRGFQKQSC